MCKVWNKNAFLLLMICMVCQLQAKDKDDDDDGEESLSTERASTPASPLRQQLLQASRARSFVPPSSQEVAQAEQLFARAFAGESASALQAAARALQMEASQQGPLLILQEAENARRGRGFFVFRAQGHLVLQTPHSFKDEMTRDIGLGLFAQGPFRAGAWNTVPRRFADGQGGEVNADMAHLPQTWFLAFTRASARVKGLQRTLQIHGFEAAKRKSAALQEAELILSAGHARPGPWLQQARACLQKNLQRNISLFGEDARELGATTNQQAAALRAADSGMEFVHVEMSRELRRDMKQDPALRMQWLNCLAGAAK